MIPGRIIVVGGGASGMLAAGRAAELGASVILLEKTERPGNKILISGQMRCNLTNTREISDFISMYGVNGRFLYGAFSLFFRDDLLALMRRYGMETRAEPDGRVFPVSNDANEVVSALRLYMAENRVQVQPGVRVTRVLLDNGLVSGVQTERAMYSATAVVLATGGASYPATGSTGDGYNLAAEMGHSIVPLRPALVPLVVYESQRTQSMQGASLLNVRLTAFSCPSHAINPSMLLASDVGRGIPGKRPRSPAIESRKGDMIFTHFGLSGPVTLQISLSVADALANGPVSVSIDLKPEVSMSELEHQLQKDFDTYGKRNLRSVLTKYLTPKMIEPFVEMSGIAPDKLVNQIDAEEREILLNLIKSLRFNIRATMPLTAAMITAGGVCLEEIDPRSMASRLVKGLYFCGEVMDIDADTGGYNLQAAFSTGYVAGEYASKFITESD
jgi:predicted flavoprotein YhiN